MNKPLLKIIGETLANMDGNVRINNARCLDKIASAIAKEIHYPEHWDDAAYPTLDDALAEFGEFSCSECQESRKIIAAKTIHPNAIPVAKEPEKMAPVQGYRAGIPWSMHLEEYDAYCKKYGRQQALIEGGCRGGFGTEELDIFIPGWREKVSEISKLKSELSELRKQMENTPTAAGHFRYSATVERWIECARYVRGAVILYHDKDWPQVNSESVMGSRKPRRINLQNGQWIGIYSDSELELISKDGERVRELSEFERELAIRLDEARKTILHESK